MPAVRARRISVVIPTHETRELTSRCVASIAAPGAEEMEVIVVDDGSRDGTADEIARRFPWVRISRNEAPEGFTRAANRGMGAATGGLLFLLNSDTEVEPGGWPVLAAAFRREPRLGIAGATLHYPDSRPQWSGGRAPTLPWLFALASGLPPLLDRLPTARTLRPVSGTAGRRVDWVTGAAMAIRREAWDEVGPLDPGFRQYCQDLDLCTRAGEAGWAVAVVAGLRVIHHHGATIGRGPGAAGRQNPELLWGDLLRWGRKHRGPRWTARAVRALQLGGVLRLAGRRLGALERFGDARRAWRSDSLAYRRALASLRDETRRPAVAEEGARTPARSPVPTERDGS
jgi:GT2 family glycosyltransferase